MSTLFFSWQSDTDEKIGHYFLRDSLKLALKSVASDASLEEAHRSLELDHDTKGVPGSPSIVETIYSKIQVAKLFVSDMTYVGSKSNQERIPNPNVLIEHGVAIKALGPGRVISVMNTAFGSPEDFELPFDLKHVRWPIRYCLAENADKTKIRAAQQSLAKELAVAISTALGALPAGEESGRGDDLPDWSIRELFLHIRPDLVDEPDAELLKGVGKAIADQASIGALKTWGREITRDRRRLSLAPIPAEHWRDVHFTMWFLSNDDDGLDDIECKSAAEVRHYASIKFNRRQALKIWRKPELSLRLDGVLEESAGDHSKQSFYLRVENVGDVVNENSVQIVSLRTEGKLWHERILPASLRDAASFTLRTGEKCKVPLCSRDTLGYREQMAPIKILYEDKGEHDCSLPGEKGCNYVVWVHMCGKYRSTAKIRLTVDDSNRLRVERVAA